MPSVFIPEGEVILGSDSRDGLAEPNEKPQRRVRLSAFEAARNLLSMGDVLRYKAESGNRINIPYFRDYPTLNQNPNDPIAGLTWYEARTVARCFGGDLPTEAQCEYVARGRSGRDGIPKGNLNWDGRHPSTVPICDEDDHTRENSFGVCDVVGNLARWTLDKYMARRYEILIDGVLDPVFPFSGEGEVVRRGCSWGAVYEDARPERRGPEKPNLRASYMGVWVVWSLPLTTRR